MSFFLGFSPPTPELAGHNNLDATGGRLQFAEENHLGLGTVQWRWKRTEMGDGGQGWSWEAFQARPCLLLLTGPATSLASFPSSEKWGNMFCTVLLRVLNK